MFSELLILLLRGPVKRLSAWRQILNRLQERGFPSLLARFISIHLIANGLTVTVSGVCSGQCIVSCIKTVSRFTPFQAIPHRTVGPKSYSVYGHNAYSLYSVYSLPYYWHYAAATCCTIYSIYFVLSLPSVFVQLCRYVNIYSSPPFSLLIIRRAIPNFRDWCSSGQN